MKKKLRKTSKRPIKRETNKRVGLFPLLSYMLKLIFIDKAFLIMGALAVVASVIFGITSAVDVPATIVLNWYYLVNTVFMLIVVSRLVTYFIHNKFEDQTMTIIIQQRTKRITVLIAVWIGIFYSVFLINTLDTLIMLALNFRNEYTIQYLLANYIYQTVTSTFLISFLFFLTLTFKQQIVSIIMSFVLLSLFIASLSQQIYETKLQSANITLKTNNGLGTSITYTAEEINDSLTFNDNVENERIMFPHLSKYIYDFYLKNEITNSNFDSASSVSSRLSMWDALGIVNYESEPIKVNGSEDIELQIFSLTQAGINLMQNNEYTKGDVVTLNLSFKNNFMSVEEMQKVAESTTNTEQKLILEDLMAYTELYSNYLTSTFDKWSGEDTNKFLNNVMRSNYSKFNKFISLQLDQTKSTISRERKVTGSTTETTTENLTPEFYTSYIFNNYFSSSINDGFIFYGVNTPSNEYSQNFDNLLTQLRDRFFSEIFIRTLEDNFIAQASNYYIITNSEVQNDENWAAYQDMTRSYEILNFVLFPANMNAFFNTFAGKEWNQFWFNLSTRSSIDFTSQDNIFFTNNPFSYDYTKNGSGDGYKILGKNSMNLYFFLATQVLFVLITSGISIYIFIRKDLK